MKKLAFLAVLGASAISGAQTWSGGGGAIPDTTTVAGSFSSTILGVPALTNVGAIAITGLTHSWCGDLVARVSSPTATVNMFVRIGRLTANALGSPFGDDSNFGDTYVFALTGGDIWTAAAGGTGTHVIPGGQYMSSDGLSGASNGFFGGAQAAGNWTLTIEDWAGGDTGGFQGWEIRGAPVPEPGTMIALGAGAAALLARRRRKA
jgi:hypothetical protein